MNPRHAPPVFGLAFLALATAGWGWNDTDERPAVPEPIVESAAALEPSIEALGAPEVLEAAPVVEEALETRTGEATYYADYFQGRRTASGERMDQSKMVAAHRTYPFGTRLRVTDLRTDRQVEVRVIDRGPYAPGRKMPAVIDLSKEAARRLGILRRGRAVVTVEVLELGDGG